MYQFLMSVYKYGHIVFSTGICETVVDLICPRIFLYVSFAFYPFRFGNFIFTLSHDLLQYFHLCNLLYMIYGYHVCS